MFAGLIEEIGRVASVVRSPGSIRLSIAAQVVIEDASVGDSVAVDGACLTVVSVARDRFVAEVTPTTARKTRLGELRAGNRVNLERALSASGRIGGHLVSGHVDVIARVLSRAREGNAIVFRFSMDDSTAKLVTPAGSVAVDGASLTVQGIGEGWFSVSLIPHTRLVTTLGERRVGDSVNLECDPLARYARAATIAPHPAATRSRIDEAFLRAHGFA